MSNLMKSLKGEIARLARKEAKAMTSSLRKPAGATRRTLADLKRRVARIERQLKAADLRPAAALAAQAPEDAAGAKRGISGKSIRSLRKRLGLSQQAFGKLVNVTAHGVHLWEKKDGTIRLRNTSRAAVQELKGLGARAAKARLAALGVAARPRKTRKYATRHTRA